jgi:hypothetical protein
VFYSWFRVVWFYFYHPYLHTIRIRWSALDAGLLLIPSSITTGIMMPFIGKMIQRGVPQAYLVAAGFNLFFLRIDATGYYARFW